jgi:MoaA/NifB/PqqE/SkfB family radical SAM enzyme
MTVPRLAFHLTDRCQLDCQHCLRDPARKALDLDVDLIDRVLDQAKSAYRVAHVTFTGGEPTLHPHFEAIVDSVVDRGMTWNTVTNGRAFPTIFARLAHRRERILGLKSIVFSLDGAEESTHDAIRERGSYREVLQAAAVCVAHKVRFGMQMIINARNEFEIEALGLLAAQLGASRVLYGMVQPAGTPHDAALFLPSSEWKRIRDRVARLSQALAIEVELPEGHYEESRFFVCSPFRSETLHVDVEGRLSLCCLHSQVPSTQPGKDVAGDLRELSLLEAHRRLLDLIRRTQDEIIADLASPPKSEWEHFHCNSCLARFGRPHWTDEGPSGATARRERWHGAWAPGPHRHALDGDADPDATRRRLRLVSS